MNFWLTLCISILSVNFYTWGKGGTAYEKEQTEENSR